VKLHFFLVFAILILGSIIPPSLGVLQVSENIPSNVMIDYQASWSKTVTWADGTMDTISVDDFGRIFLNGKRFKVVGFVIQDTEPPTRENADKMLEWCERHGIRVMELWISPFRWGSTTPQPSMKDQVDFWMPLLYKHKMFTVYIPRVDRSEISGDPDVAVSEFMSRWKGRLDLAETYASEYLDIIFGVGLQSEYDTKWSGVDLETFLSQVYPQCKEYLKNSGIGDVPLHGQWCSWGHPTWSDVSSERFERTVVTMKYSDLVCANMYANIADPDLPEIFRSTTW